MKSLKTHILFARQVLDVREDEKLNEASNDTNVNNESFNAVETSSSCNNISNDSGGLATKVSKNL